MDLIWNLLGINAESCLIVLDTGDTVVSKTDAGAWSHVGIIDFVNVCHMHRTVLNAFSAYLI